MTMFRINERGSLHQVKSDAKVRRRDKESVPANDVGAVHKQVQYNLGCRMQVTHRGKDGSSLHSAVGASADISKDKTRRTCRN